ncbi:TPA: restriction endonuclease subunit S [Citrobacter amalonaticus]|uniref:restriction endonuclease subunit S n=1 Tax=Enterobacteriaceae TaxID=543 RepID=UPI0012D984AA|nr:MULTISPECIES: restriction endonuclease subunit S [Klebsiella]HAU5592579.1 restriction endonuclease subunit S [Citrobacter amalonaticus]HDS4604076.1 restriction endonuclease subunit S [Citrobacter freundii]ELT9743972.1 restriction endonuclease subunit S [Klebsiella michiganensis]MCW9464746.1 restriction endonuclease subunit S [Klebsiella michiganensis]MCY0832171.1 restriction endonuclease subunit S [Klebsiella michiganensis]
MSKVAFKRLGDLITLKRGYDLPEKVRIAGPYPVISSSGVSGWHNEYKVEGPGVVTGRYGTLGEMYYVEEEYWPHNTALYVQDFKGNDPKYIYYLLSCLGRIRTSDKSAVPGVNRNELHEMAVPAIEDLTSQKKIREVLESIDEKIALNNRIIAELEAMAKTLYYYWFVQFDFPDANGKPYKTSGGKMEYNATLKREIPAGWSVTNIGSITKTVLGGTPSTENDDYWKNANIPWLSSAETASFPVVSSEQMITSSGIENSSATLLSKGTVVISIVRYIRPSILGIDAATNQSVVGIRESDIYKSSFIYSYFCSEVPRLMSLRTGAQQPHINKGVIDESPIALPPSSTLVEYYKLANPVFDKIMAVAFQNHELVRLRDWLLPLLMNGQVTVK